MTIGGALLAALVLAVFAYLLADAHSEDREGVEQRFNDVAKVSASVTDGLFQTSLQASQTQAATQFAGPVDRGMLEEYAARGQSPYVAVLDAKGKRIAATKDAPPSGPAVDIAIDSREARLSDLMGRGSDATVEWAIPYDTPNGRRILVQGINAKALSDFLGSSLGGLPNFADAETVMVDSKAAVLGGSRLSTPAGQTLEDEDLIEALEDREEGKYGDDRYFASAGISGSPFRIVLDTSEDDLYESITGQAVSWIIFGAFALMALIGLYLLRRAALASRELERRELNERHAVEINDNIIQGLALAKYQLQAGDDKASAAQVADTLREAQHLVSGLLGDAEVQAGQLRREIAAETTGPEPPEGEPRK
jgi:hypothetical protein